MTANVATRSRALAAGAAVVAGLLFVTGCGGPSQLSDSAAAILQKDAGALSSAARAGNAAAVTAALAALRRDVDVQRTAGGLTGARADSILAAAGRVAADQVVPAAPRPSATTAPVAAAPRPTATRSTSTGANTGSASGSSHSEPGKQKEHGKKGK